MHPQLEILLQLQDLKTQRQELARGERESTLQEEEFNVDLGDAVGSLDEKIEELEERLEPRIRNRYRRVEKQHRRAVVPVIRGTCYGCFISIAISDATDAERNAELLMCDHCGRFLYVLGAS